MTRKGLLRNYMSQLGQILYQIKISDICKVGLQQKSIYNDYHL